MTNNFLARAVVSLCLLCVLGGLVLAGELTANEERLYKLQEQQIGTINSILTTVAIIVTVSFGVFALLGVILQYIQFRQERAAQKRQQERDQEEELRQRQREQDQQRRDREEELRQRQREQDQQRREQEEQVRQRQREQDQQRRDQEEQKRQDEHEQDRQRREQEQQKRQDERELAAQKRQEEREQEQLRRERERLDSERLRAERDESRQVHLDAVTQRTAELIGSVKSTLDIASEGQKMAMNVGKQLEEMRKRKEAAYTHLETDIKLFLTQNRQFAKPRPAVNIMVNTLNLAGLPAYELPPLADFVRGYAQRMESNYEEAIKSFTKVIESKADDAEVKTQARLYRAIDNVNLEKYADALKDFDVLAKEDVSNVFYAFYAVDTKLLAKRSEFQKLTGLAPEEQTDFQGFANTLKKIAADAEQPAWKERGDARFPGVLQRAIRSRASILIFELDTPAEALKILPEPAQGENAAQPDMISLWLRFIALDRLERATELADGVKLLLNNFSVRFQGAIEPRTKLLLGMILAKCYFWVADDRFNNLKVELEAEANRLIANHSNAITVFSPVSQRNVCIGMLQDEIPKLDQPW